MAEKEYIEREALINDLEEARPLNWTDSEAELTEQADFELFENLVKSQSTADVQEVVRCKDCIWWESRTVNKKGFVICPATGMDICAKDYCSYGEKRSEQE